MIGFLCVFFKKWLNIIPLCLHLFIHNFTCMQSVEHIPHESVEQGEPATGWEEVCVSEVHRLLRLLKVRPPLSSSGVDLMLSSNG